MDLPGTATALGKYMLRYSCNVRLVADRFRAKQGPNEGLYDACNSQLGIL